MAEIIKIALLGITGVLFAIQFRQQRPEYALLIPWDSDESGGDYLSV